MEKLSVPGTFYKFKVKNHKALQKSILAAISARKMSPVRGENESVSNTDWIDGWEEVPTYWEGLHDMLEDSLSELQEQSPSVNNGRKLQLLNYWFQQYLQGDYHGWHIHAGTTYSSVYYVELTKGGETQFLHGEVTFNIKVEEGDFLIFPSSYEHRSSVNNTGSRKTVIAINLGGYSA